MGENNFDDIRNKVTTTPPPKKGKGLFIAILAVGLVAVLGIAAFATGVIGGKATKNQRVAEALISLAEGEDNAFVSDWIGEKELSEEMLKGFTASGNLELVSLPGLEAQGIALPKGIMLSFETSSNSEAGTSRGKLGIGLMGSSLLNAEIYTDQSKMQVAVPALFDEIIAADFSGDLNEKIKNAPLFKDMVTEEMLAEVGAIPQALAESQELSDKIRAVATGNLGVKDYPALETALNKFRDSWTVEEAEAKTMTWNGTEGNFDGFHVTITKDSVITLLNDLKAFVTTDAKFKADFMDYLAKQMADSESITMEEAYTRLDEEMTEAINDLQADESFKEAKFTVYMTKDNELVSFHTVNEMDESKADFLVERYGGDFPNQNMKAVVTVEGGEDSGTMTLESTGKTEGNVQNRDFTMKSGVAEETMDLVMKTSIDKESGAFSGSIVTAVEMEGTTTDFTLEYKGKVEDVVKGKSATYVLDELKVLTMDELQAELKGELKYSTGAVTVAPLEGTEVDVFTATQEDMEKVMNQIMENIGVLMQFMGGGLGF